MRVQTETLMDGVTLHYIHSTKFKDDSISVHLVRPLDKTYTSYDVLIPPVLRRGTKHYPDMLCLSRALDLLYGAQIYPSMRKKGENLCLGLTANYLKEAYLPEKRLLLEPMMDLLGEMLMHPAREGKGFVSDYVSSERKNQIDSIHNMRNDKREYAAYRANQTMFQKERFGISALGNESVLSALTPEKLYRHYRDILAHSQIYVVYIGSAKMQRVTEAFRHAFHDLPRKSLTEPAVTCPHPSHARVKTVRETMDVTQGKLVMGFSATSSDTIALLLANALFGSGSTSKLFLNVREKQSLCYYAYSQYLRSKGVIMVATGIECDQYPRVRKEILHQLQLVQQGNWEDWEWDSAIKSAYNSLSCIVDSKRQMEEFCLGSSVLKQTDSLDAMLRKLKAITRKRVVAAAQTVSLDTVYFLEGGPACET